MTLTTAADLATNESLTRLNATGGSWDRVGSTVRPRYMMHDAMPHCQVALSMISLCALWELEQYVLTGAAVTSRSVDEL